MKPIACLSLLLLAYTPNHTSVDTGHGTVQMQISGSRHPTVVFESGFSDTDAYWNAVISGLPAQLQTVRYDRAGIGQSPLNSMPRTANEIADELHTALKNAGVSPPYVMVGHSAGGMYVRVFAHRYPSDVAGLVLVDPAPEEFYDLLAAEDPALWAGMQDALKDMPAAAAAQMRVNAETVKEVREASTLPRVPVTIISGTKSEPPVFSPERRLEMTRLQTDLARHIAGARHIDAPGCGHNIPGDCPAVVVQALDNLLKAGTR